MAGEIEFLDPEPAPGQDEQLPGPRHGAPSRRGRTVGIVVAVLLVGTAFAVRLASGGSPTAAPRPTVATASGSWVAVAPLSAAPDPNQVSDEFGLYCDSIAVRISGPRAAKLTLPVQGAGAASPTSTVLDPATGETLNCDHVGRPTACPEADDGQSACTSTSALPAAFVQAVRARLPGARVRSATSEITRQTARIWYRQVSVGAGDETLTIVVEQPGIPVGLTGSQDDGSHLITRVGFHGDSYNTIVVVTSPSGSSEQAARATADALVRDHRVAAVA